ncbi:hypothetical protein PsorP6_015002 [Peronosclerospora sorghi]|uniref:Uncharacterized protein n=1 Tax=Peronosclerospora sorghi TaxID=230839 RepID=A0ACC0VT10_9STRA|nr:hypothetical protein PsorP6_015002 [Peronosclerospora sorghi]
MTHNQALENAFMGFFSPQNASRVDANALHLQEVDSQQLLADTDVLLESFSTASPLENESERPRALTKQELARERAGQRRDAYRQRLKFERESLRLQEEKLTKRLATLKKRKDRETMEMGASDALVLGAWRALAMRQYEDRRQAEKLKKRLMAAVTQRARMIQDLELVVRKRVRDVQTLATLDDLDLLEKKPRVEDKDTLLYTTYSEHLDALYGKVDEVFATVGLNPTPGGILSGNPTKKKVHGTECFETIGVGNVPFDFQRTCDAVWELVSVPHRQEGRQVYHGLPDADNSIALQFYFPLRRKNGKVLMVRSYHVARRYIEPDRVVFVWRALCEAEGEFTGVNSDETGWAIVHAPTTNAPSLAASTMTLVQGCIRLIPMNFNDGSEVEGDGKVDQFMELLVQSNVEDNREIERMMDRLLLDDALATDDLDLCPVDVNFSFVDF